MMFENSEDAAWLDWKQRFAEVYDESNYSSPIQAYVMNAGHKLLERDFDSNHSFARLIEIGAGTGEHALHVRHEFDSYFLTDMDDNTLHIAKEKVSKLPTSTKFSYVKAEGSSLPYTDGTFDRLIATHVLEHIPQPHLILKEWARVVRDGGTMSILIPTDPGLAWRLGRMMGPRRSATAKGIAYDYVMAREHVNSCTNLIALIRHYFSDISESWWPMRIPSVDLNLLYACNIHVCK